MSFGMRTAQRYMRAAERPKLQSKSDTLSFLTEASVRGAIANDHLDGTVPAIEKVVQVAGQDVVEDLAGPMPIAAKSTIKALAEMTPAAIRHATSFMHGDSYRKSTMRESVRRSLAAKRRKDEQDREARETSAHDSWTHYAPPQVAVDAVERCDECGGQELDVQGGCLHCLALTLDSSKQIDPEPWRLEAVLRELTEQARRVFEKCPAADRETMAYKLIALGQEILENGELGT
jgi:hypothetical protein